MIEVFDNKKCCGCNACVQICPTKCIEIKEDEEGFLYPVVDKERCISCNACEKVCPMLNVAKERKPIVVYALKNKDDNIRLESSSGGAFTAIANIIINKGGVVFGASYSDDWLVVHSYAETKEDLKKFRGSKYVQSSIGDSFIQVKKFLQADRWVLFSGTPCQVRGLLLFLKRDYEKLLTVDLVCHGVPSQTVFSTYLHGLKQQLVIDKGVTDKCNFIISNIAFRDKTKGWHNYEMSITYEILKDNLPFIQGVDVNDTYLNGFGRNLFIRPSCYHCPSKRFKSMSDVTLADFWGCEKQSPDLDDDKGTSLVSLNTKKAKSIFDEIVVVEKKKIDVFNAYHNNIYVYHSILMNHSRSLFFHSDWKNNFLQVVNDIVKNSPTTLVDRMITIYRFRLYPYICRLKYKFFIK